MKKIRVGIIGCGTIGFELSKFLLKEFRRQAIVTYVCDHHHEKANDLIRKLQLKAKVVAHDKLIQSSDLIIETASAHVSGSVALKALALKKHVLIMSVGGLLKHAKVLLHSSKREFLHIPSGAISGLDGLYAAREGNIQEVKLVTRKPAEGLREAPYFSNHKFPSLKKGEEYKVFSGSAVDAVKNFPQNINVAAALSLFGVGAAKTYVEIWTSSNYKKNQHEVSIEGDFGKIHTRTENVPSPVNPKTSYLAVLSAKAMIRHLIEEVFPSVR